MSLQAVIPHHSTLPSIHRTNSCSHFKYNHKMCSLTTKLEETGDTLIYWSKKFHWSMALYKNQELFHLRFALMSIFQCFLRSLRIKICYLILTGIVLLSVKKYYFKDLSFPKIILMSISILRSVQIVLILLDHAILKNKSMIYSINMVIFTSP
jgi:hypothetical protein